jgi:hypothetical protein
MVILLKVCIVLEGVDRLLYQKALGNFDESVR